MRRPSRHSFVAEFCNLQLVVFLLLRCTRAALFTYHRNASTQAPTQFTGNGTSQSAVGEQVATFNFTGHTKQARTRRVGEDARAGQTQTRAQRFRSLIEERLRRTQRQAQKSPKKPQAPSER